MYNNIDVSHKNNRYYEHIQKNRRNILLHLKYVKVSSFVFFIYVTINVYKESSNREFQSYKQTTIYVAIY